MKKNTVLAILALAMISNLPSVHAEKCLLISGGQATGKIVLPDQPSRSEQFAAEELQKYLEKITGVVLPIEKTMQIPPSPAIILGRHPGNFKISRRLQTQYPLLPPSWKTAGNRDAFTVVGEGSHLHLVGNSDTALLYAAWDWLETLGVRWIMPGERGTYIPSLGDIAFLSAEKYERPGIAFRGSNFAMPEMWEFPSAAMKPEHGIPVSYLYSYRLRLNSNVNFQREDIWPSMGSGHSYSNYLPVEQYYKDHPEWYNLIDGKRQNGAGWQLCFTNRESAKEFAKNVEVEIVQELKAGIPIERMRLCVSPNDCRAWCECPKCQTLKDADGSATSMVTNYSNLVAAEIHKHYPQTRIVFYAYDNYARPGDHVKPGPDVCPELVFWTANIAVGANHAQPMFSKGNPKMKSYFEQWSKRVDQISVHEYYGHYTWFTPWPKLTQMAADIPVLAQEPKCYGMFSESHLHWGTQGPNFYLHSKLMWNPVLDVKAVMDDYYAKAFGPAGPDIKQYYQVLQNRMDRLSYICGNTVEIPSLLTVEVVAECDACMARAQGKLAGMDPGTRWRTKLVIAAWRQSAKMAQAVRLFVSPNPRPEDRATIVRLLGEISMFLETDQGKWAFEHRIAKPVVDQMRVPLCAPLNRLPAGTHNYDFSMEQGGAIKFLGQVTGFQPGLWGYSLGAHNRGTIDLPLCPAAGRKLTEVTITTGVACNSKTVIRISVGDSRGQNHVLGEGVASCSKPLAIPRHLLGHGKLDLRIQAENKSADEQIILTSAKLNITVK